MTHKWDSQTQRCSCGIVIAEQNQWARHQNTIASRNTIIALMSQILSGLQLPMYLGRLPYLESLLSLRSALNMHDLMTWTPEEIENKLRKVFEE